LLLNEMIKDTSFLYKHNSFLTYPKSLCLYLKYIVVIKSFLVDRFVHAYLLNPIPMML